MLLTDHTTEPIWARVKENWRSERMSCAWCDRLEGCCDVNERENEPTPSPKSFLKPLLQRRGGHGSDASRDHPRPPVVPDQESIAAPCQHESPYVRCSALALCGFTSRGCPRWRCLAPSAAMLAARATKVSSVPEAAESAGQHLTTSLRTPSARLLQRGRLWQTRIIQAPSTTALCSSSSPSQPEAKHLFVHLQATPDPLLGAASAST